MCEYYKEKQMRAKCKGNSVLGVVAHARNPATWEAEIVMIMVQGQSRQKSYQDSISTKELW
jgi:hypothetical protein